MKGHIRTYLQEIGKATKKKKRKKRKICIFGATKKVKIWSDFISALYASAVDRKSKLESSREKDAMGEKRARGVLRVQRMCSFMLTPRRCNAQAMHLSRRDEKEGKKRKYPTCVGDVSALYRKQNRSFGK